MISHHLLPICGVHMQVQKASLPNKVASFVGMNKGITILNATLLASFVCGQTALPPAVHAALLTNNSKGMPKFMNNALCKQCCSVS